MKRILTTIGVGRLVGFLVTLAIVAGAVVAVPLLVAADDRPGQGDSTHDVTVFQQGLNELRIEGFFERANDLHGDLRFEIRGGVEAGGWRTTNVLERIADLTGTDESDIVEALADGQTLADYAAEHGVTEDALLDALMEEIDAELDTAVEDGDLTEGEAEQFASEAREHLERLVNGDWPFGGFGIGTLRDFPFADGLFGFGGHEFWRDLDPVAVVAELTDTDPQDVSNAIDDGQTFGEYAAEHGVSEDELVAEFIGPVRDRIDEAVASGDVSENDAAQILASIEEHVRGLINGSVVIIEEPWDHFDGPGNFGPFGGIFDFSDCDDSDEPGEESTSSEI